MKNYFHIELLGAFQVFVDARPARALETAQTRLLLTFLAIHMDHGHSRAELATLIWPGVDSERARHRLNQALHSLRRNLGVELFVPDREFVRLNQAMVSCDLLEFRELLRSRRLHEAKSFPSALAPGLNASWLDEERLALQEERAELEDELSKELEATNLAEALHSAEHALRLDPTDARFARVKELLLALGRTADAKKLERKLQEHKLETAQPHRTHPESCLLEAIEWLLATGSIKEGYRTTHSLTRYWISQGPLEDGARMAELLLERLSDHGSLRDRLRILHMLASLRHQSGNYQLAAQTYREGVRLASEIGDESKLATLLDQYANLLTRTGSYAKAQRYLLKSSELREDERTPTLHTRIKLHCSRLSAEIGEWTRAQEELDEALASATKAKDDEGLFLTLGQKFAFAAYEGRTRECHTTLERLEALKPQVPGRLFEGYHLLTRSRYQTQLGDWRGAASSLRELIPHQRILGERYMLMCALHAAADVLAHTEEPAKAANMMALADQIQNGIGCVVTATFKPVVARTRKRVSEATQGELANRNAKALDQAQIADLLEVALS